MRRPGRSTATSCSPGPPAGFTRSQPRIWLREAPQPIRGGLPGRHQVIRAGRSLRRDRRAAGHRPVAGCLLAWLPTEPPRRRHQFGAAAIRAPASPARWRRAGTVTLPIASARASNASGVRAWAEPWAVCAAPGPAGHCHPRPPAGQKLCSLGTARRLLVVRQPGIRFARADQHQIGVARGSAPGFPSRGASQIAGQALQEGTALQHHPTR